MVVQKNHAGLCACMRACEERERHVHNKLQRANKEVGAVHVCAAQVEQQAMHHGVGGGFTCATALKNNKNEPP